MSNKRIPSPQNAIFKFVDDDDTIYQHKRRKAIVPRIVEQPHQSQQFQHSRQKANKPVDTNIITINSQFLPARALLKTPQNSLDNFVVKKPSKQLNENVSLSKKVSPKNNKMLKGVNSAYGEEILSTVIRADVKMDDILGNENAKRALEESVIFPILNPELFSGLRQPCKGILLFGPPGNGKTMLAKAVATESECTFFNISAATIISKWIGESERLMQALFQMARNAQPSIIFIDEVDSMLSERNENESGASRRVKTEFLLQFDGCSTKSDDRILVLGATNRPQELDDGVLRRFPRRIYIDLPDEKSRAALIKHNFHRTNTAVNFSDRELMEISRQCENYSFSDLSALCREASMFPLRGLTRELLQSAKVDDLRPVSYCDLVEASKLVRASCNQENIKKLKKFASQFA